MRGQACCFILGQGRPSPAGKGRHPVSQPRLPAKRRAFGPRRSRPEAVCRPGKAHSGQGNSVCRPQMAGLGRATALVGRKRRAAGRAATLAGRKWRAWDAQRRWSAGKGGRRTGRKVPGRTSATPLRQPVGGIGHAQLAAHLVDDLHRHEGVFVAVDGGFYPSLFDEVDELRYIIFSA